MGSMASKSAAKQRLRDDATPLTFSEYQPTIGFLGDTVTTGKAQTDQKYSGTLYI